MNLGNKTLKWSNKKRKAKFKLVVAICFIINETIIFKIDWFSQLRLKQEVNLFGKNMAW
jgi:hypothetical protein